MIQHLTRGTKQKHDVNLNFSAVVLSPSLVCQNICKVGASLAHKFVFIQGVAGLIYQGMFLSLMYIDITEHTCILKLNCHGDSIVRKMCL